MSGAETFGELLLRLRTEAGRTQEKQAEVINTASGRETMSRREISRYENNENIPTNHTVAYIAITFGLPPEQLQKYASAARARRRNGGGGEEQEKDDVQRRTLIEGALIGATATATEPWGRLAHALTRQNRLDTIAADALTQRAGALHVSEQQLTARQLRGQVETHLDAITAVLPRAGAHERALTVAAGETAALAGWVSWDLGDHQAARAYYRVTADCADAAGHPPLRALALGYASYGTSNPARAQELLDQAAQHVRGPGNATAAAWVHSRHAEEAASRGDGRTAQRALDRARVAYGYADHMAEQAWVRFMTPARLDSLVLSIYGHLAHPELTRTAEIATQRLGLNLSSAGVVILGDLAAALLQGGDTDQGIHVARQFAVAAAARPTSMSRARAAAITRRLPESERDLAEHLRSHAV